MKSFTSSLLITLIGLLLATSLSGEPNHPELDWHTFESEHFIYHYHNGTEQTARMVLNVAEEMYPYVTGLYDFEPATKTHVIIMDTDDYANGGAYYFENKILLWASPLQFDLRGNHNWIRNVFTHEFSHIVSLGKAMKYPISIPAGFIQIMDREKPYKDNIIMEYPKGIGAMPVANVVVPMWWAEGVAQYQFAKSTGDLWDSHRDMLLRDRALNGKLYTWNEASYFDKKGTGNESVYNTGYAFVRSLSETYGPDINRKIAETASSARHWSFNRVFKSLFGKSGRDFYNSWRDSLTTTYLKDTETIRLHEVKGNILLEQGPAYFNVSVSSDGEKTVLASAEGRDYIGQTFLSLLTDKEKVERLDKKSRIRGNMAWGKDNRYLYYVKQRRPNIYGSVYFDLARYDFDTEKSEFLTENARIYSVTVSARDEIYVIFVRDGTHNIARLNSGGTLKPLTFFEHGEQVYDLDISPDGTRIIFDLALNHGRDIYELDIKTRDIRGRIIDATCDNRHPVYDSDGKSVIYSSDKTGIFNLYSRNTDTGEDILLTNITGAAFYPDVSPDGQILYTLFENGIFKLAELEKPEALLQEYAVYRPYTFPENDYNPKKLPSVSSESYTSQFSRIFFMPYLMIDYNRPKYGFAAFQNEVLNKYNLYTSMGIATNKDMDIYARLDFNFLLPAIYLEGYYVTYHLDSQSERLYELTVFEREITFRLWEAVAGMEYQWMNHLWHISITHDQYSASIKDFDKNSSTLYKPFGYTYFKGTSFEADWTLDFIVRDWHSDINPRRGFSTKLTAAYDVNRYLQDFGINEEYGTFQEIYSNENTLRLELDSELFFPVSFPNRSAFSFALNSGWQENAAIDSFFHYYGGGRPGLKGYPFYAIEGTKKLILTGIFRFPLISEMHIGPEPFFFNRLYGGIYYQAGDAWRGSVDQMAWKQNIGFEIRLGGHSFYSYPLAITLDAVYGFNSFSRMDEANREMVNFGKEWRFYWSVLFNFPNRTDPL
jgi:Tol biopolymer transport system component